MKSYLTPKLKKTMIHKLIKLPNKMSKSSLKNYHFLQRINFSGNSKMICQFNSKKKVQYKEMIFKGY